MREMHAYDSTCSCKVCHIHHMIDNIAIQAAEKLLKQEEADKHKETAND